MYKTHRQRLVDGPTALKQTQGSRVEKRKKQKASLLQNFEQSGDLLTGVSS